MRILAVNRFYRPDRAPTSELLGDLAEHLAAEGHEVIIITSRMRYDDPGAKLAERETLNAVKVIRVATSRMGRSADIARALDYLTFYISAFFTLLTTARRGDVIIAKTDPPLISIPAGLAARLRGARLVNWLQDLFPEVAEALGVRIGAGLAGRTLRALRNRSLKIARLNVVLNEAMAGRVRAEGVDARRIKVLKNWAPACVRPVCREENTLRRDWGLMNTRVIGYSGNLGRAHMAGRVAALVRATRSMENLTWLFIGGGAGLGAIRAAAKEDGASNILFRDYQPRETLSESLSVPDLHLISLDPACEGLILPSKLYGVMAAGRPAIFLGDPRGAGAAEVAACGPGAILDVHAPETWRAGLARALDAACGETGRGTSFAATRYDKLRAWSDALSRLDETKADEAAPTQRPRPQPHYRSFPRVDGREPSTQSPSACSALADGDPGFRPDERIKSWR